MPSPCLGRVHPLLLPLLQPAPLAPRRGCPHPTRPEPRPGHFLRVTALTPALSHSLTHSLIHWASISFTPTLCQALYLVFGAQI